MKKCSACGASNPHGTPLCYACAEPLVGASVPAVSDARQCDYCGTLNPHERAACGGCGAPVSRLAKLVSSGAPDILETLAAMRVEISHEFWPEGDPVASREVVHRLRDQLAPDSPEVKAQRP